jgi:hypothetical protein
MTNEPHIPLNIPIGAPVAGFDGKPLGRVREVHPHYILVGREGQHDDLDVPVHAITSFTGGTLHVSIKQSSASEVDDVETAHRTNDIQE